MVVDELYCVCGVLMRPPTPSASQPNLFADDFLRLIHSSTCILNDLPNLKVFALAFKLGSSQHDPAIAMIVF